MLDASDHVAGPFDAPYELVMYGDFQCPYCTAAQSILQRVRDRLEGRLRFGFRHFPLISVHPDAWRAAEAAEAASAQRSFWEMHDALYANGGRFAVTDLVALADRILGRLRVGPAAGDDEHRKDSSDQRNHARHERS